MEIAPKRQKKRNAAGQAAADAGGNYADGVADSLRGGVEKSEIIAASSLCAMTVTLSC